MALLLSTDQKAARFEMWLKERQEIERKERDKLSEESAKFIKHARKNYYLRPDSPYIKDRVGRLPICPKCERVGLRHNKGMACPECKYEGPYTTLLRDYVAQRLFR